MENMEKRKGRRTKKELEDRLWTTLEKQIIEKGVNNITITGLAKEAGFEPLVIYNRFKDLDELLENYVRRYDYWLKDVFKIRKDDTPQENLKRLLVSLINDLYDNEIMQRILLWELNDTHRITRRIAKIREIDNAELIEFFKQYDFNGVGAMMIAGIYYLIMHRKISTFCEIDYNSPQGKEIMIKTVENMVDSFFAAKASH